MKTPLASFKLARDWDKGVHFHLMYLWAGMRKARQIWWMQRKVNFQSSSSTISLAGKSGRVPYEDYLKCDGFDQSKVFFCMGSVLGKDCKEEDGLWWINVFFVRKMRVNLILLHCDRARVLWKLVFSMFGIARVMSCLVKKFLLKWHAFFL